MVEVIAAKPFPMAAGVWLGLGLGGFFDGIVLHQMLQWHHMLSSWYPINSLKNLRLNTLADGVFHSATYVFVVLGIYLLWRAGRRSRLDWSNRALIGAILIGWGLFNLVEGIVDHEILGVHHVNETVPVGQRVYWDMGFLAWGLAMIWIGSLLGRSGRRQTAPSLDPAEG
jgi:uncharacterized membrane protein